MCTKKEGLSAKKLNNLEAEKRKYYDDPEKKKQIVK